MKKTTLALSAFAILAVSGLVYLSYYYKDSGLATLNATRSEQSEKISAYATEGILIGNPEAPVTVEEHMSYLCGHCLDFASQTYPVLKEKYVDSGKVNFRVFVAPPVELSLAAICAADQGLFEKFNDHFIENIQRLTAVEDIAVLTREAGLEMEKFNTCYNDEKFRTIPQSWAEFAKNKGVDGTPIFFVNGERIEGNQPIEVFEQTIERKLAE